MPQRPARPRVDETAGDLGSLVRLGLADPPPEPAPPPAHELPDAAQSGMERANEARLQAALSESGVSKGGRDEHVIDVLARLDPADVDAVAAWLKQKKDKDETGPKK
ncbi:hypothetical protein OG897_13730 [Streptomyces sp. NBC_00237]|uniref:hypothetical protein n=1 Tax=Streptomyces sp. NBC_00237 TaxID=2975687 RepID=UPI002256F92C|nr:hypothetical protein [Streptomyces sp. NBC_00237]MCX5202504.1 hypothetical protein [Streptomyces sp. NBC_00237]